MERKEESWDRIYTFVAIQYSELNVLPKVDAHIFVGGPAEKTASNNKKLSGTKRRLAHKKKSSFRNVLGSHSFPANLFGHAKLFLNHRPLNLSDQSNWARETDMCTNCEFQGGL